MRFRSCRSCHDARSPVIFVLALLVFLAACGDDGTTPPVDAGTDLGGGDLGGADLGGEDLGGACRADRDCDDGVFCNGIERCTPGAPGVDARGCAASPGDPCGDGRTCNELRDACETRCETMPDADGDGVDAVECGGADCDDGDARRYAGATEVCDGAGVDEDCDDRTFGTRDVDGDGFVDAQCCNGTTCGTDCNDARADIRPGGTEVCNGIDDDCDGMVDEGVDLEGYVDADFDGVGDETMPTRGCAGSLGFATAAGDCDDRDPRRSPRLLEACDGVDNDCNEVVDDRTTVVTWYPDRDGDGFGDSASAVRACAAPTPPGGATWGYVLIGFDCDDADAATSPVAREVCDGRDNDCNGRADYRIVGANFEDDDLDGSPDAACAPGGDCNDLDATVYPGAPELCDDIDNNCNGRVDEGTVMRLWYADGDGDGYGTGDPVVSCPPVPGRVTRTNDCDDADPRRYPGAPELCDGVDQSCDGSAAGEDLDEDGELAAAATCSGGLRAGLPRTDCNDANAAVNSRAAEVCNGVDDDCDGVVDGPRAIAACLAAAPHRTGTCLAGRCEYGACDPGFDNCDGSSPDCESELRTDDRNCGRCGNVCGGSAFCRGATCATPRRVFVRGTPVLANFGSAAGADMLCQTAANARSLGGTWRAWVADATSTPAMRFTRSLHGYVLLDGTKVADDWADLTDGTLDAPITVTETGASAPVYEAWTGTNTSGTATTTACGGWTMATSGARPFAAVGGAYTDPRWVDQFLQYCDRTNVTLLCFEQ
jgi:hypothetical protein